jgi:predicted transcriptional regulator of viral defense system/very-short-patch-repair endonuclease
MAANLPDGCRQLIELQRGVLARWQAQAVELKPTTINSLLRSGRWQPLQRGVYATFSGTPSRDAELWAAVLRVGPHAILSHQSAAELDGLTSTRSEVIHVTVPDSKHIERIPGIRLHRSERLALARHPSRTPPRTRIEETVLDLTQTAKAIDGAFGWLCQGCGSRLTTSHLLLTALNQRHKVRWRDILVSALQDIGDGAHSVLEIHYVRDVERPHGLPRARRQARVARSTGPVYLDNLVDRYRTCIELDGKAAHPVAGRWRDIARDNASAADGITTLRYGWPDVAEQPCQTAAQIATVLGQRGWVGQATPCGRSCPLGRS